MPFDLIIANPPFSVASKITQATVELAKQSIYLMPFGKYKKYELFQYVSSVQSVDETCFVDAAQDIQPNLLICKLQNTRDESKRLIDMEKFVWNTDFATFYEKNEKIPATFQSFVYNNKDREFVEKNLERILFIPYWPHVGNAQKEKSVTRKANLGEKESLERILKSNASYSYFLFDSKLEKENAFKFWVSDLCNKLILGCLTRTLIFKFPHVDWSHSWTEQEIQKEFGLSYIEKKEF